MKITEKGILVTVTILTYDDVLSTSIEYFEEEIEAKAFVESYLKGDRSKFISIDDFCYRFENREASIENPMKKLVIMSKSVKLLKGDKTK